MSVSESTPKYDGRRSVTSVTTSSRAARGSVRSIMNRSRVISSDGAKDGGLPVRTAWAPRTIMLPAAWRKMWVSSAIGTGRASTSSANGLPAPTGASWSASPTSTTWVCGPTARRRVTSSSRLAIEVSSTMSRSVSSSSTVGPWPGIQPRAEWTVEASRPLDSDMRRAARPVGATNITEAFCSAAAAQMRRIVAVLPVPGPPVTIERREANAARTAAACSGAGTRSSAGGALDALRLGGAAASSATISARSCSSFAVGGR